MPISLCTGVCYGGFGVLEVCIIQENFTYTGQRCMHKTRHIYNFITSTTTSVIIEDMQLTVQCMSSYCHIQYAILIVFH